MVRTGETRGTTILRGGRVIDPSQGIDRTDDVTIVDGRIEVIGPGPDRADRIVDADGLLVCPGLVDMHVHLREPGGEAQETIETGTRAAAAGGFTAVACMPNTNPPIDDAKTLRFVLDKAKQTAHCRVYPVAAMTKGRLGREAVDLAALQAAGAVAFSDDGAGVNDRAVMQAVVEQARQCDALLIQHCEVAEMAAGGVVNLGTVSRALGVPGIDPQAEEEMIARDLELLSQTPARYHVAHVSTAGAVERIRQAKRAGLPVTAEATVHHIILNEEACLHAGPNAKMNPPLRSNNDVEACRQGLAVGTIDCIVTDHAPHTADAKAAGWQKAPFGVIGLETAWPLAFWALVESGRMDVPRLVELMSTRPARILGLSGAGTLAAGAPADVTVIDPRLRWVVQADALCSKSRNTPFLGWKVTGRPVGVMMGGAWTQTLGRIRNYLE
jgi:dihydroorotase